jgi:hypothetical protein
MIPANGAPHDLEARDVLRSLSFAMTTENLRLIAKIHPRGAAFV